MTKQITYKVFIPSADGKRVKKTVPIQVPVRWCEESQAWVLTPKAHSLIEQTKKDFS